MNEMEEYELKKEREEISRMRKDIHTIRNCMLFFFITSIIGGIIYGIILIESIR